MCASPVNESAGWLLLIHQIPAKPGYLRVKIWRRLQGLGAIAVKNAVYALPASPQAQEDFEWVLKEILEAGGEAMICEARLIDGLTDAGVRTLFNAARAADYAALLRELQGLAALLEQPDAPGLPEARARLGRLMETAAEIVAIDFFGADGRVQVEGMIVALTGRIEGGASGARAAHSLALSPGQVWVTRQGVHIDRIASAWLIRRFIDPAAQLKFVPGKNYLPAAGELRFDMFEAEFTHEGDRCTFEVLMARAGLTDPALTAIAEIVHDIDLKEAKFGRAETEGIAHLVAGLCVAHREDETRIARGAAIFEDLHAYFSLAPGAKRNVP